MRLQSRLLLRALLVPACLLGVGIGARAQGMHAHMPMQTPAQAPSPAAR